MKVEVDSRSGFCGGVIRAIDSAEKFLANHPRLYSLGAMVHNEAELQRLESKGLVTVSHDSLDTLGEGDTLLIRAHGEPPETYAKATARGLEIIDCTCPVVLRIQQSIREAHRRLETPGRAGGDVIPASCGVMPGSVGSPKISDLRGALDRASSGTIVIFGKIGHPEVLGLVGQVGGDAIVVENREQLLSRLADGSISGPAEVFSQTTKSPVEYEEICNLLATAVPGTVVHKTICSQVASRHEELAEFARNHDAIVFVAGRQSSNGHVLYELCHSVNPRSFHVVDASEVQPGWFSDSDSVGVCGATSTPKWLLEEVAKKVLA